MSMMWIKRQSKWAIAAAALLILAGLVLMDLPSNTGMSDQSVGKVEGEEIPVQAFQQELQNYVRGEEARLGRPLQGLEYAQLRENLFQFRVQSLILQRLVRAYSLRATVEEMQNYLIRNAGEVSYTLAQYEGPESVPPFLQESTFDMMAYRNWLSQDSVYDRPGMRVMELQLKTAMIPQLQLQQIFRSQVHRTDLEERFLLETREDQARLHYYFVPAAAFPVNPESFGESELKAHFRAQPDSFWRREEAARLRYVRLSLRASAADTALMRDFAAELRERAESGESFEDLARSYSSDQGSAGEGGRLGLRGRDEWVPEFADAAFALEPGQISRPVLTPYGYHLILLHEKKREDGVEKADVSHILLDVASGSETSDSLHAVADRVRRQAEKVGLEAAAREAGLAVEMTPVFERGTLTPLGGTYVGGLSSFAFSPAERKAKVSEPLQNEEGIYVFERADRFPKGRDFDRSREAIALDLARKRQLDSARTEAERLRPQLAEGGALPARAGRAELHTTGAVSAETFVPGFGFGSAALFRALNQPREEWGPVLETPEGAVIAQVVETLPLDEAEKARRVTAARSEGEQFQVSNLYQAWVQEMPKAVKVENNLDRLYRN